MTGTAGRRSTGTGRTGLIKGIVCVALGLILFFLPVPAGVDPRGMHMLGIFIGTILALILQPLPTSAVAIIGLALAMATGSMSTKEAFSGLGSGSVWLIVAAYFIAQGFVKTGLGRRIAIWFLSKLGGSSLGTAYGLAVTDLILSPAMPSNTARLGGVLFPIITSIGKLQGSTPEGGDASRKRIGAYLCATANNVNAVTSAMFLTAMAGGPICMGLAAEQGITLDWVTWALGGIVPGLVALALIPRVVHAIFPPTLKDTPEARRNAIQEQRNMGRMSVQERIMGVTFLAMLVLWCLGSTLDMAAVTVAFLGVSVLLVTRVIEWKDMAANKSAWQTLIFFGILIGMASQLNTLGVISWIGGFLAAGIEGMSWPVVLVLLTIFYFVLHYLFASELSQISALYTLFLTVAIAAGVPPLLAALMLGAASALMGAMTHYASGPAALIFGAGYLTTPEYFRIGAVCGVVMLATWLTVGLGWWHIIGIW